LPADYKCRVGDQYNDDGDRDDLRAIQHTCDQAQLQDERERKEGCRVLTEPKSGKHYRMPACGASKEGLRLLGGAQCQK
jgi:hypothetical protein